MVHDVMADHGEPTVRVGMHQGPPARRDGDFFGATVKHRRAYHRSGGRRRGVEYLFCSEGCAELFARAPEDYAIAS